MGESGKQEKTRESGGKIYEIHLTAGETGKQEETRETGGKIH